MSSRRIGGVLNVAAMDALYGRERHRPTDRATIRAAALELRSRGLTPQDIAQALRISEAAVRAMLEPGE